VTTFLPDCDKTKAFVVDSRSLNDTENVAVVYHNPLDNVKDLAHHFFTRCLAANIVPYVVTKKTVFKWQEGFWTIMKDVFDRDYKDKYISAGLLDQCGGELQHLISDAATMQIIRWTKGGFGMAAHNYDGDMLTDEVAQVHRSPGFITSNLIGKRADGVMIKEFEASHGTVADLWHAHLRGEETSMNPLGMIEAVIGAMEHSATLASGANKFSSVEDITHFTTCLRTALHDAFRAGEGTRDMSGPSGLTTEAFITSVAGRLAHILEHGVGAATVALPTTDDVAHPDPRFRRNYDVDADAVKQLFAEYDVNGDGSISMEEFETMIVKLGVAPKRKTRAKRIEDEVGIIP
jgi:isocitrate dehydrogenase